MNEINGLEFSVPANNQKIIEIYNKLRSGQLAVNKDYQRKLVWKKSHKINFIDTILKNYPFPEVYLAQGNLDQQTLTLMDEIVDGQQRLTTIKDYIEGTDIFALPTSITKFSELTPEKRASFLNYEISIRYLKGVTAEQVREIFQRINKTDYALNSTERLNAQWGDSEFVCFAKQLIEKDFESDEAVYKIDIKSRHEIVSFFHGIEGDESVFTANDMSRMFALQYIMTLVATMDSQEYFSRNDRLKSYIENYNDSFPQADELKDRILNVTRFISFLNLGRDSRWYKKANLFSLIVELDKIDTQNINKELFSSFLTNLDVKATLSEIGLAEANEELSSEELKYFNFAREAVNEKNIREYRGEFIRKLIDQAVAS